MDLLNKIIAHKQAIDKEAANLAILEQEKTEIEIKIKNIKGLIKGNKISIRCCSKKLANLNYKI